MNSKIQEQVDLALAEFEEWSETASSKDYEAFIAYRKLAPEAAELFRETFRMESRLQELTRANHSNDGALESMDGVVEGNHGTYRFIRPLGAGGMGTVWLANQTGPVQKEFAVKLIRAGLNSEAVGKRFEAERQALAMMSHPHIAKIMDAGQLPDGRPFFVMEFFPGIPLTEYCNERRFTLEQRLACSCSFAMPSSMRIKRAFFIVILNRPTCSWQKSMANLI